MPNLTETAQNRYCGAVVLASAVLYLFFVFSYMWYLPNYNLLRLGGRFIVGSHATFKAGIRHNNFNAQADKGIWLEKISKTTPETKRDISLALVGATIIMAALLAMLSLPLRAVKQRQNGGYGIFAHQYAYLSMRAFRI